ncbi:MAG: hypothetical protein ACYDCK_02450 [Thermoplasmatota archaeon]
MALGIAIVLVGVYLFYFQAGIERWISIGILTAGVVLFVGFAVMAYASGSPSDDVVGGRGTTVVREGAAPIVQENREIVQRNDRIIQGPGDRPRSG